MSEKRASLTQPRPPRAKPQTSKVSVLLPADLQKKVAKAARAERRAMSPQIVVLIEEGLAARQAAAA